MRCPFPGMDPYLERPELWPDFHDSPDNKRSGEGRDSYLRKRDELWESRAHLVEIDLLRDGTRSLRVSTERPERRTPWCYVVLRGVCVATALLSAARRFP